MDRITWLKTLRRASEEQYDTVWAPLYWEKAGLYDNTTHLQFIRELLDLLPQPAAILDAACGAGRYEPFLLEKGHSVLGIDQSQGMLERARGRFPGVRYEKTGLQEMAFREAFEAVICMDAMENLPPEDWPLVLGNFNRALKPGGWPVFTAETLDVADEDEVRQAFEKAQQAGLPVVFGENPEEGVYHYHPTNGQVREWTQQAGFEIRKEADGHWYHHLLARKAADLSVPPDY
jgi:SAM-dependent methyltransferase